MCAPTHTHTQTFPIFLSLFLGRSERSRGCPCCQVGGWHSRWRRETRRAPIISRTGKEISTSLYLMLRERTLARLGKKGERKKGISLSSNARRKLSTRNAGRVSVVSLFRYSFFFFCRLTLLFRFDNFYRHCDMAENRGMSLILFVQRYFRDLNGAYLSDSSLVLKIYNNCLKRLDIFVIINVNLIKLTIY